MQNAQDLSKILDHALSHLASRIRLSIQTLVHPKHQHVRGFCYNPKQFQKKASHADHRKQLSGRGHQTLV